MAENELLKLRLRTREAREKLELTQDEVSSDLKIERNTYASYESKNPKSKRSIPRRHIAKFCEITKINEKWLLTGLGPRDAEGDRKTIDQLLDSAHQEFDHDTVMLSLLDGVRARAKELKEQD